MILSVGCVKRLASLVRAARRAGRASRAESVTQLTFNSEQGYESSLIRERRSKSSFRRSSLLSCSELKGRRSLTRRCGSGRAVPRSFSSAYLVFCFDSLLESCSSSDYKLKGELTALIVAVVS